MVAFEPDETSADPIRRDFELLAEGGVHASRTPEALEKTAGDLAALGYEVVALDADTWTEERDLHDQVRRALQFPDYYGRNLDALEDCLGDVAEGRYGWSRTSTGLAVVVWGFDRFDAADPHPASVLVDIAERTSRFALLFGHRMLWLTGPSRIPPTRTGAPLDRSRLQRALLSWRLH